MKLTDRQYAILMQGLAVLVEVSNARVGGASLSIDDLAVVKEAQAYCVEAFEGNMYVTFGEVDDLLTTLLKIAASYNMAESEQELAMLEPTSKYLH